MRWLWLLAVFVFVGCKQAANTERLSVDSCNEQSYRQRYCNLDSTVFYAEKALELAGSRYSYGEKMAKLNLAFVDCQRMNFHKANRKLKEVRQATNNQLVLLCADVLQMRVSQRNSDGPVFFSSFINAQKRLARIKEEKQYLTANEDKMLLYAETELHIIASTYYYYEGQDSLAISEIGKAKDDLDAEHDTVQWINYNYMIGSGGLTPGADKMQVMLTEFDYLFRCYSAGKHDGVIYFEANALQSLASMVMKHAPFLWQRRYGEMETLFKDMFGETTEVSTDIAEFPFAIAVHALLLFRDYGDPFQVASSSRTLGELYIATGKPDIAVEHLLAALECVQVSDEILVPECESRIHQQLCIAYSAMGMKEESDMHRTHYLDILHSTSQNLELESRTQMLQVENKALRIRLFVAFVLLVLIVVMGLLSHWYSKRSSVRLMDKLAKEVQENEEETQEMLAMSMRRRNQNKQSNIERRAKVTLLHAIIPFIDRIVGETIRIRKNGIVDPVRMEYISELTEKIEEYNQIMTRWIEVKQGKLGMSVGTVNLGELFTIISSGHYAFDQKGVKLSVVPTDAQVKADKALTLFMINTLADNARKFTPEGGTVSVSAEEQDDVVTICVEDTGCGLSQEDCDVINNNKVFDASKIGDGNNKGFGFGIMNCRGIIEKYKKMSEVFSCCNFGVQSEKGKGTRFHFSLPKAAMMLLLVCFSAGSMSAKENATALYDSVYECNVAERYADAVEFAEKALKATGAEGICLYDSVRSANEAAELLLFNKGANLDYKLIVGLRNEVAISALALGNMPLYSYNNYICNHLYKLTHQDRSLPDYCVKMEKTRRDANSLLVILVVFTILLAAMLVFFWRKVLLNRELKTKSLKDSSEQRLAALNDERSRAEFEEMRLHVQNEILDNCLSSIKHETMYYPSRIRQMVANMQTEDIGELCELVEYYRNLYTLLCSQADAQVAKANARVVSVPGTSIMEELRKSLVRKCGGGHVAVVDELGSNVLADEVLVKCLAKELINGLFSLHADVQDYSIRSFAEEQMAVFAITVSNTTMSEDELHNLFNPESGNFPLYVVRQIVREHDSACGNPGLRLYAEATEQGYRIVFTLRRSIL